MSELKLLSCPFCGGEATISDGGYSGEKFLAHCSELSCLAASGFFRKTHDEAIAAWNRRSAPNHVGEANAMIQPENEPLTLDELRGMDGEPVWMARAKKWVFVSTVVTEPYVQVWYFFKGFVYAVLYYHEKFYRNKPERSEG